ncbi:UPF0016-domain-containing protein [Polychaeton citri CBS 116435]|uniref:UPF0016-domain-containing protein n=1 Tax=Polychaeton citri CBS 116435 TaxID=1314669 RepID=A0A9P4QCV7_9PEZI|nr:UPF0016-domain-containing protein [Polychaeton citri CBS 116435]
MKLRRGFPLLLLLAPSLASAKTLVKRDAPGKEVLTNDEIISLNRAKSEIPAMDAGSGSGKSGTQTSRKDIPDPTVEKIRNSQPVRPIRVGTEDAPVDGLDGKPHAGPFVDTTPEEKNTKKISATAIEAAMVEPQPTSLSKYESKFGELPEKNDGVMNDEGRQIPRKGTTGTEGGVSERAKERKLKGETETKPKGPEEAPPLPHDEQERIEANQQKKTTGASGSSTSQEDGKIVDDKAKKVGGEYGAAGGFGMDKPTDLPEKPHNIPHPDPKTPSTADGDRKDTDGPPIGGSGSGSGSNKWLQDTMDYSEGKPRPKTNAPASYGNAASPHEESYGEFFHSFVLSFAMIIFSEIGDKTFLVAALMAMRHDRLLVFSAALSALVAMTILSAVLGHAVPTLLPKRFTTFAAALLFLIFGAKMLKEGLDMPADSGVGEEMREVEAELEEKEHSMARRNSRHSSVSPFALESGKGGKRSPSSSRSPSPQGRGSSGSRDRSGGLVNLLSLVLSPAWVQTFVMTFLGEWGDRSQIATIAMAAGQDYWWVTIGAIVGHACCTGLAVIGGRALAGRVSMRVVTIGGAVAFLFFGVIYLYECLVQG